TVHDRYQKRYSDSAKMGRLYFSDIDITVLSPGAAMVFGKWQLDRENDQPGGLFTLLFRKTAAGWRIVHDHTSSSSK
ncbi:MAG: nuclear transport factor 2 family protein, partial [Calditrichia bacterium]